MAKNIVVTNLRIDKNLWLQIKQVAFELGMSANEYMNFIIQDLSQKKELSVNLRTKSPLKRDAAPIWQLGKLHKNIKSSKKYELSEDDKLIYE